VGVSLFTNGINTETKGVEVTLNYASDFGEYGHVDWSVSGNYNDTKIKKIATPPVQVQPQSLFDLGAQSDLTTASPKYKIGFGAYWTKGPWSANLRETVYGKTSTLVSTNGATWYSETIGVTGITDLEGSYAVNKTLKLSLGANNLFDQKPPNRPQNPAAHKVYDGSNVYDAPVGFSPYGINGGYYYARAVISF